MSPPQRTIPVQIEKPVTIEKPSTAGAFLAHFRRQGRLRPARAARSNSPRAHCRHKRGYATAKSLKSSLSSPHRMHSQPATDRRLRGCSYQHATYEAQLSFKPIHPARNPSARRRAAPENIPVLSASPGPGATIWPLIEAQEIPATAPAAPTPSFHRRMSMPRRCWSMPQAIAELAPIPAQLRPSEISLFCTGRNRFAHRPLHSCPNQTATRGFFPPSPKKFRPQRRRLHI